MNVVLIANMPWDHPTETNRHAWARGLLAAFPDAKVLYLETIGWHPRRPRVRTQVVEPGFCVYVLHAWNLLPRGADPTARLRRLVNHWLTAKLLKRTVTRLFRDDRMDLVVTFDPLSQRLASLPAVRSVYDCLDLYRAQPQHAGARRQHALDNSERETARNVDEVVATSAELLAHFEALGTKARHVPGALSRPSWHGAIGGVRRPSTTSRLGAVYIGALDPYKVDLATFDRMLSTLPGLTLTIVGRAEYDSPEIRVRIETLAQQHAVTYLGQVPRDQLGAVLARADFGVVSLTNGAYGGSSFPLKYWDYQWAGLPTLAVNCNALAGLPGVVSCAKPEDISRETVLELLDLQRYAASFRDHAAANDAEARVMRIMNT